jgi:hypothetical protein
VLPASPFSPRSPRGPYEWKLNSSMLP